MIAQDALAFLLLTLVGVGGALPTKGKPDIHDKKFGQEEITIYDASVSEPTRVPAKIEYVEGGTPVLTTTEKILVLPTPAKDADKDKGKSKEKEVKVDPPEETEVSASKPSGPVPVVVGGENGGPLIPQGRPPALPSPPRPSSGSSGSSRPPPPSPESKSPGSGSKRFGISYAPYRADHGCKTAGDIEDDFQRFAGDYSVVRIYGTDCDQVPSVYRSAKSMGVKVMLGIWDIHDVENEASKIVAGLGGDWDIVHSVSVGNELVNNGQAHPAQVVKAVRQAREILRTNGYKGPVVTVDTFIATEKYPELCEESDYCAINAHPFFDSTMEAKDAGKWLAKTIEQVQSKLSTSKHIVVTETGWPMDGAVNGLAVPGLENQKLAVDSIKKAFSENPGDIILFSAFNDLWKQRTMTTFDADQFWGIGGAISRSDL